MTCWQCSHSFKFRIVRPFELLIHSTSQHDFLDACPLKIVGAFDRLPFLRPGQKGAAQKVTERLLREDAMTLGQAQRLQGWLINR